VLAASRFEVIVMLPGPDPGDEVEPAYINDVTCTVYRRLNTSARHARQQERLVHVVNGRARSVVAAPLASRATGGHSIAVHDRDRPAERLIACGDIPEAS
jgi:hypothetical protein